MRPEQLHLPWNIRRENAVFGGAILMAAVVFTVAFLDQEWAIMDHPFRFNNATEEANAKVAVNHTVTMLETLVERIKPLADPTKKPNIGTLLALFEEILKDYQSATKATYFLADVLANHDFVVTGSVKYVCAELRGGTRVFGIPLNLLHHCELMSDLLPKIHSDIDYYAAWVSAVTFIGLAGFTLLLSLLMIDKLAGVILVGIGGLFTLIVAVPWFILRHELTSGVVPRSLERQLHSLGVEIALEPQLGWPPITIAVVGCTIILIAIAEGVFRARNSRHSTRAQSDIPMKRLTDFNNI